MSLGLQSKKGTMSTEIRPIEVVICLGSPCLARGNADNLRDLKSYLEHYNVAASFRTRGQRCRNDCTLGPMITIDGINYDHVKPGSAVGLLELAIRKREQQC
jgi:NADH:ubiquinone oxidoreductase subunit E